MNYNDYDYDYGYTTGGSVNGAYGSSSGSLALVSGVSTIFLVITLAIAALNVVSQALILKKLNKNWWAVLIPFYNMWVFFDAAGLPGWLSLVPVANIIGLYVAYFNIAKNFGKSTGFAVCTIFFPIICLPILAFSKSAGISDSNIENSYESENFNVQNNMNTFNESQSNTMIDNGFNGSSEPIETPNEIDNVLNTNFINPIPEETTVNPVEVQPVVAPIIGETLTEEPTNIEPVMPVVETINEVQTSENLELTSSEENTVNTIVDVVLEESIPAVTETPSIETVDFQESVILPTEEEIVEAPVETINEVQPELASVEEESVNTIVDSVVEESIPAITETPVIETVDFQESVILPTEEEIVEVPVETIDEVQPELTSEEINVNTIVDAVMEKASTVISEPETLTIDSQIETNSFGEPISVESTELNNEAIINEEVKEDMAPIAPEISESTPKICPQCSNQVSSVADTCFMCGYKF